jgi:hypothetical protein
MKMFSRLATITIQTAAFGVLLSSRASAGCGDLRN